MDMTLIGSIIAALLTIMVFSYLLGANPLWRIAQSLLVGVSVGYVTLVILTQVIAPQVGRIVQPGTETTQSDQLLAIVPIALGLLLLLRIAYPGAWPASFALNLIVVVGASLALAGALAGTIVPQSLDTMRLLDLNNPYTLTGNIVLIASVICALAYFTFGARPNGQRPAFLRPLAATGRWLLILTFGAILGSLAITFYSALIGSLDSLIRLVDLILAATIT